MILRLFKEVSTCYNMTLDTYNFFVAIVTSKMELFGTVFNSFYFLITARKNFILDVLGVLDPTLITDIFALHSCILINLKSILALCRKRSISSNGKKDGWLLWDGIMLISNNLRKQLCTWWNVNVKLQV